MNTPSILAIETAGFKICDGQYIRIPFGHIPAHCTIGVVGDNGAGKSTLFKILGWAEHGDALTGRGGHNPHRHPDAKESRIVVWRRFEDGRILKVERRQTSAHQVFVTIFPPGELVDGDGGWLTHEHEAAETLCSGLVSTVGDSLTRVGVPPTSLYQAACAAAQDGAGSFGSLSKLEDRRAVIEAAADLGWLAPLAELGSKWVKPLRDIVKELERRAVDLRSQRDILANVEKEIIGITTQAATADAEHETAKALRVQAEATEREAYEAWSQAKSAASSAQGHQDAAAEKMSDLQTKADAARTEEHAETLAEMRERLTLAKAVRDKQLALKPSYDAALARLKEAEDDEREKRRAVEALGARPSRPDVEAEVATLEPVATKAQERCEVLGAAQVAHDEAKAKADALRGAATALVSAQAAYTSATDKLARLRRVGAFVEQVPCKGGIVELEARRMGDSARVDCSTCPALADAKEALVGVDAAAAEVLPADEKRAAALAEKEKADAAATALAEAERQLAQARRDLEASRAAEKRLAELRRQLDRLEQIEAAERARVAATVRVGEAKAARDKITEDGRTLRGELAKHLKVSDPGQAKKEGIEELERDVEARALAQVDGGASAVEKIHADLAAAKASLSALTTEVRTLALATSEKLGDHESAKVVLAEKKEAEAAAQQRAQAVRWALAKLEGQREPLAKAIESLPALEAALTDAQTELADYTLKRDGFGSKGAPGLIIDAEGAQLAADVEEIAEAGYQRRVWEAEFRAFDPTATKRNQEQADLYVRESGTEAWRLFTEVSGGERKMLDQALMGAFRRLTFRRTGYRFPEIFHDERDTGLALNLQPYYVPMLLATGEGRHIIVSHNEHVQAACDYRLILTKEGGATWEQAR